jgi:putative nucleotidyltransferase with HDIG domain
LLYAISIVAVCFLFPREGKFPYEFQKGKIWGHEDLYAPFDIPILKTRQETDAEKDSLRKSFVIYYNYQPEIVAKGKELYREQFDKLWNKKGVFEYRKEEVYRTGIVLLDSIYNRGIVQEEEGAVPQSLSGSVIILKNNIGEEEDISSIFTQKSAYESIMSHLARLELEDEKKFFKDMNMNDFILPNLAYNADITDKARTEQIGRISPTKGVIPLNRKIVGYGEVVNDEKYNHLVSFKYEFENKVGTSANFNKILTGQIIIVVLCFMLVYLYLMFFRPEIFRSTARTAFLLLIMTLFFALSGVVARNEHLSLYILPYVLIPVLISSFFDARTATFVFVVTILLAGFIAPNSFEFVFLNFIAGIVGIVNVRSIYRRGTLFKAILWIILAYCVVYTALILIQGDNFHHINWKNYLYFAASGILVFIAYPLIFIFEKTFGFLSDITLMELSDTNHPLLRKMSEVAPGTFQHSLQVANLSEEVIQKIGGNPLLVRTAALYHDIGKINRPVYFIENQAGGRNPHEDLSPENSAQIIIEHVTNGVEIARKNRIPQQVADFIRTHHGTTTVRYFYHIYQKQNADKTIDRSKFTYPGPAPFTREMVVLMMCDSIEAASRSLKDINHRTISDLVDNIINYQVLEDQYNDANITYREINTAKRVIKNRLMNIYHVRIEYPKD